MTAIFHSLFSNRQIYTQHSCESYLNESRHIAETIIRQCGEAPPVRDYNIGRVEVHHYHFWDPFCFWPSPYERHRGYGRSDGTETLIRLVVGIFGTVLCGYAFHKCDQAANQKRTSAEEIDAARVMRYNLQAESSEDPIIQNTLYVAQLRERIFSRIHGEAVKTGTSACAILVSGIMLIAGAVFASVPVIIAGTAVVGLTALANLVDWMCDSSRKRNIQDAHEIMRYAS